MIVNLDGDGRTDASPRWLKPIDVVNIAKQVEESIPIAEAVRRLTDFFKGAEMLGFLGFNRNRKGFTLHLHILYPEGEEPPFVEALLGERPGHEQSAREFALQEMFVNVLEGQVGNGGSNTEF